MVTMCYLTPRNGLFYLHQNFSITIQNSHVPYAFQIDFKINHFNTLRGKIIITQALMTHVKPFV
jgi:hypothetical protein